MRCSGLSFYLPPTERVLSPALRPEPLAALRPLGRGPGSLHGGLALTPLLSLTAVHSSSIRALMPSVGSIIPHRWLSTAQSLARLSCWYCRAGSWMAWMSMLVSTSFPTLAETRSLVITWLPGQGEGGRGGAGHGQVLNHGLAPACVHSFVHQPVLQDTGYGSRAGPGGKDRAQGPCTRGPPVSWGDHLTSAFITRALRGTGGGPGHDGAASGKLWVRALVATLRPGARRGCVWGEGDPRAGCWVRGGWAGPVSAAPKPGRPLTGAALHLCSLILLRPLGCGILVGKHRKHIHFGISGSQPRVC